MELHPFDLFPAMAQSHDYPVIRFRGDFETSRQAFTFDNQGVITPGLEGRVETFEDRPAVVLNFRSLDMHNSRPAPNTSAKNLTNRLVSQADSQDRHSSSEAADQFHRYSSLGRTARPR